MTRATRCHHLFQLNNLWRGTWYSNGNGSSGSAACMQLRSYVLYAGSSLWISPSKCLGLEPKWHCHFGIPRHHRRLYHVSTLMVGRLGDLWEWTVLNHQHVLMHTLEKTLANPQFSWLFHKKPYLTPEKPHMQAVLGPQSINDWSAACLPSHLMAN